MYMVSSCVREVAGSRPLKARWSGAVNGRFTCHGDPNELSPPMNYGSCTYANEFVLKRILYGELRNRLSTLMANATTF